MRRLIEWWRERKRRRRADDSALNIMMALTKMMNPDAPEPPYIKRGGAWLPPGVKR